VIGGVGSGKSIIAADWLILQATLYPKARLYYMGAAFPAMREGTTFTLTSRLIEWGFDWECNRSDLIVTIKSGPAKGARLIATSSETYIRLKGQMIDRIWCDEAQTWNEGGEAGGMAYDFVQTRLRLSEPSQRYYPDLQPQLRLTANPPHSMTHWLYKKFVKKQSAKLIQVTTFDNTLLRNREEYIERLRSILSPELFKIEVMGEWGELGVGRVYTSFDTRKHVGAVQYDPSLPLVWTHDFGVDPRVSLVCQVDAGRGDKPRRDHVSVLGEYRIRNGSTYEQIEEFVRDWPPTFQGANGETVTRRVQMYGDPAGQARNTSTGRSDWDMLKTDPRLKPYNMSFHVKRSAPLVVDRVNAVNCKLENAKGQTGITISPACKELIDDLSQTKWKEGTRQLDHGSIAKGLLRTHLSDALGYFIEAEWPVLANRMRIVGYGQEYR